MKRSIKPIGIAFFSLIILSLFQSCSEKEYNNPANPEVTILPPANLQLSLMTDTSVTLSWSDPYNFSVEERINIRYEIHQSINQGSDSLIKSVRGDSTRVIIKGSFFAGNSYYFKIRTVAGNNTSEYSASVSGSINFAAPSNLQVIMIAETQATLNWTLNNPLATMAIIERSTSASSGYIVVDSVLANVLRKEVNGIYHADTTYYFRVKATSSINQSAYTQPVSQKLLFPAPTDIQVAALSATTVSLRWTDNNSFETGFEIYSGTDSTNLSLSKTEPANAISSTLIGSFDVLKRYYFRVRARSVYNVSVLSVLGLYLPAAPHTAPMLLSPSTGQTGVSKSPTLSWGVVSGATSYELQVSTNSSFSPAIYILTGLTSVSYPLSGLTYGTIYYWRVRGANLDGNGPYSSTGSFTITIPIEMVYVSGGTFQMGSTSGDWDEQPVHSVTLSSYYLGKYEVTQAQWREIVEWKQLNGGTTLKPSPSLFNGANLPVEQVYWVHIQLWISYLNERDGTTYRLPTEAEWEFAARGGNKSQGYIYSGSNTVDEVAWYYSNSSNTTHPVGTKAVNELGIYDMSGNVWEWCQDYYGAYNLESQTNPSGPSNGTYRVVRGGSWYYLANYSRVTFRDHYFQGSMSNHLGFRLARTY
ncbi:MAG: SUMF1/EgtB/PvdO family nonheme iron enzyme [bacterium]